jgi:hypothetical protein
VYGTGSGNVYGTGSGNVYGTGSGNGVGTGSGSNPKVVSGDDPKVVNEVNNMVNIISKLQQSGGSLTGDLTYSAIGSDSIEYCFDNKEMEKSCIRVGPGIIEYY